MRSKKWLIFMASIALIRQGMAQNWDVDIAKGINPRHPNSDYWKATSTSAYVFGAGVPIGMLVVGVISKDKKLDKASLEVMSAIITELIISESMKISINRLRPGEKYPNEIFPYHSIHGKSFPSGHSSLTFSLATSLAIQYKKWYITVPAYLWAVSVDYSRLYLGVHYPSDVMAGATVGIGSALLAHWINRKLFGRK